MTNPITGIHHITAIAADPQRNLDFYTQALGLRLVKLTVNFDDPGTYHFYFGDPAGRPGTILTFFPWSNARRGRRGLGQLAVTAFRIPAGAMGYWQERLRQHGVSVSSPFQRFDEDVLTLLDPDGLQLELVASGEAGEPAFEWEASPVPAAQAIRGFAAPTLLPDGFEQTAALLENVFGLQAARQSGQRYRFVGSGAVGGAVDIEVRPQEQRGAMGAGVVHHIAWRVPDEAQQAQWRERLLNLGLKVTEVMDRQYFKSIYFREPGGILFEIATDPPGFTLDETPERLGTQLKLPPWYEPRRAEIEGILPKLRLPAESGSAQPAVRRQ